MTRQPVQYFIGESYQGHTDVECDATLDSIAYFCSTCGSVWARAHASRGRWRIESVPCKLHEPQGLQDLNRVPGSVLNGFLRRSYVGKPSWAQAVETLPLPMLVREFNLALRRMEG